MAAKIQGRHQNLRPLAWYKELATVKGRRESGFFIVEGPRQIAQILQASPALIDEILVSQDYQDRSGFGHKSRVITPSQFSSLSSQQTPQGVLAVVALPREYAGDHLPRDCGSRVLLLEDIQDPGNVGTLVRTAAAFYFDGIVLSGECADPFSPKAVQASAGAVLALWIRRSAQYRTMAQHLQKQGFTLIATHTHGDNEQVFANKKKICVALGNEGNGLSGQVMGIADAVFAIPCDTDAVESLNVAAAGAICLYLSGRSS